MNRAVSLIVVVLLMAAIAYPAIAAEKRGKLESFEGELTKPAETSAPSGSTTTTDTTSTTSLLSGGEIAAEGLMSILYSFFLMGLQTGEVSSKQLYEELKLTGSPALPTIKIEPSYHYVINDVNAAVGRIEAGYLSFGADFEYMRYFELNAPDLTVYSGHFLLRSLFARFMGINLALGAKSIWGAQRHTGFELGFPFYIYFTKHLILDVLPYFAYINGKRVYDMAGGFSVKYGVVGARAYYRALHTGNSTLHGPGIGVFIQW